MRFENISLVQVSVNAIPVLGASVLKAVGFLHFQHSVFHVAFLLYHFLFFSLHL